MCGIAGLIDFRNSLPAGELSALAGRMARSLAHRGPDGEGVWHHAVTGCAFGHRRLSIIDTTSGGAQPMVSADGRFAITFNGEVYNFLELRRELESLGAVFRSRSDTEVLLEAYRHWGHGCLDRLDGMFAFAVHDSLTGETVLARDPFGEKPLYYAWLQGRLAFASEILALRHVPGFDNSVSAESVAEYLALQYVDGEDTLYRQVRKLRPGSALAVSRSGSVKAWRYFTFDPTGDDPSTDLDGLADQLEDILTRSLERRLISDVPLGAFLSGGVDSSLVAALVTKRLGRSLKTFTLGFAGSGQSEHLVARQIAEHLGTEHRERVLETSAVSLSHGLGGMLDEPNADTSCLPTYLLAAFAREHVTVAVSGDGGDELFGGYGRYMRTLVEAETGGGAAAFSPGDAYYSEKILVFPDRDLREVMEAIPGRLLGKLADLRAEISLGSADLLHRMRKSDVEHYLPGAVLAKVDRMSMRHGLEVRTPFLNVELARFAERLGTGVLVRGGRGKLVLRQLACRYLPAEIVNRPKSGFGLPTDLWGEASLRDRAGDLFGERSRVRPFVSAAGLDRFRDQPGRFQGNRVYQLWSMIVLQAHLQEYGCVPVIPPQERRHVPILVEAVGDAQPVAVFCRNEPPSWTGVLPAGSLVFRAHGASGGTGHEGCFVLDWTRPDAALESLVADVSVAIPRRLILVDAQIADVAPAIREKFDSIAYFDGSAWHELRRSGRLTRGSPRQESPVDAVSPLWYDRRLQEIVSYTQGRAWRPWRMRGAANDGPTSRIDELYGHGAAIDASTPRRALRLLAEGGAYLRDQFRERQNRRRFVRSIEADNAVRRRPETSVRSVLLFTSHLGAGGAERQLCNLAAGLASAGCEVTIVTVVPASGRSRHYADLLHGRLVRIHALSEWHDRLSLSPLIEDGLSRIEIIDRLPRAFRDDVWAMVAAVQSIRPDVVHCFLDHPNIVGGLAGVLCRVPAVILSFRNFNPTHFDIGRSWFREYYLWLVKSRRIVLTANSRGGLLDYAGWLGLPAASIHYVPNGLDLSRFDAVTSVNRSELRARFGLAPDVPVIAGLFRYSPEKRPWLFLKLVAAIRQRLPALRVLLAGEGNLEVEVRRQIRSEGLEDCVNILGRVSDVASVMRAADLVVLVSSREGTPNVLLEAQSLGTPVVATSAGGGSAGAVDHGRTGFIVADHDFDGLRDHTLEILTDPALRARLGGAAPGFVRREFSMENMIQTFRRTYESTV